MPDTDPQVQCLLHATIANGSGHVGAAEATCWLGFTTPRVPTPPSDTIFHLSRLRTTEVHDKLVNTGLSPQGRSDLQPLPTLPHKHAKYVE